MIYFSIYFPDREFAFCFKLITLDNLANSANVLPVFLHIDDTLSSKLIFHSK